MLHLANTELTVDLLDPHAPAERERQGTRYCWGGYIWQVHDRAAGPLLAGCEWPNPTPSAFNGQGLPESFRHAELGTGRPLLLTENRGFIIGVGDVAPGPAGLAIMAPCRWTVTTSDHALEFSTVQQNADYACRLMRRIELSGRELISTTRLTNTGARSMPLATTISPAPTGPVSPGSDAT